MNGWQFSFIRTPTGKIEAYFTNQSDPRIVLRGRYGSNALDGVEIVKTVPLTKEQGELYRGLRNLMHRPPYTKDDLDTLSSILDTIATAAADIGYKK